MNSSILRKNRGATSDVGNTVCGSGKPQVKKREDTRVLCEDACVLGSHVVGGDPLKNVMVDHINAPRRPQVFERVAIHSSSMFYNSFNKYPDVQETGLRNNSFVPYDSKHNRNLRGTKKLGNASLSRSKFTGRDGSGTLHTMLSRSTASGSQVLSSPGYLSEPEEEQDSSVDLVYKNKKPQAYPYDVDYHSGDEDESDEEAEEDEEEEEDEGDDEEEEEENAQVYDETNGASRSHVHTRRGSLPNLHHDDRDHQEEDDEDGTLEYSQPLPQHAVGYPYAPSMNRRVKSLGFYEDYGDTIGGAQGPDLYDATSEDANDVDTEQQDTIHDEHDENQYSSYYTTDPMASSAYPHFPDYSRYETAKSQNFQLKKKKKKALDTVEEAIVAEPRDISSSYDGSQFQTHVDSFQDSSHYPSLISQDAVELPGTPSLGGSEAPYAEEKSEEREFIYSDDDISSYAVQDVSLEPYTLSEIDAVVDIVYNPQKGRCVMAKKVFQPGEIIFIETPTLVAIPSIAPDLWERLQELNNETPFELPPIWHLASLYALTKLSTKEQNIIFDKWVPEPRRPPGADVKRILSTLRISVDAYRYERFLQAWRYNSFGHHVENEGLVLYNRISMISHNCSSTATWHYGEDDAFILRARQIIPEGSEITISYIGDDDLYKATHTRQEKLAGWLFTCQCLRCSDLCDSTRGFRCPCCGAGTTFFRTVKAPHEDNISEDTTSATPCTLCQRIPSKKTIKKYIMFENAYIARLDETDKSDLSDAELVYSEAQRVFTQHWALYSLDTLLFSAYRDLSLWNEAHVHQQNRIEYVSRVVPKASYTLAWLYEELGDVFANGISMTSTAETLVLTGFQRNFLARMYETAMNMLFILCGSQHNYTITAHKKLSQVFGSVAQENT